MIIKALVQLLQVKKIIAIAIIGVFCYLAVTKFFTPTEVLSVVLPIGAFYFGQSTVRQTTKELTRSEE